LTTLTNEERAQNDASPLSENNLLVKAAQLKANDMATRGYFAHTSPDGKTPWYWLEQVGYHYSAAGENLAVNFFESSDVAQAWMNSPTHRDNIVKKDYKEIGIAVASGIYEGRNTVFVAQFFGTPLPIFLPIPKTSTQPKVSQPLAEKAPVAKPKPKAPAVTTTKITPVAPKVVAVAPTATQVLGEEETSVVPATLENQTLFSRITLFIQKVISYPREYLTYIDGGIFLLIAITLLLVLFIRFEMAHPKILAHGAILMSVIILILFMNMNMFSPGNTKVPTDALSATVIAY
jgi:hypothetical protein